MSHESWPVMSIGILWGFRERHEGIIRLWIIESNQDDAQDFAAFAAIRFLFHAILLRWLGKVSSALRRSRLHRAGWALRPADHALPNGAWSGFRLRGL